MTRFNLSNLSMPPPAAICLQLLLFAYLSIGEVGAGTYSDEMLAERGVTMKNGMYFCASMGAYIRPYSTTEDVGQCAFAVKAQAICATSPHTQWRSGRCFCPESGKYYGEDHNITGSRDLFINYFKPGAPRKLDDIAVSVKSCTQLIPRDHPFGRTVGLKSESSEPDAGFIVEKLFPHLRLNDRRDYPGEQGSPLYAARIGSVLDMRLGFECLSSETFRFPSVDQLITNVGALVQDIGFFPADGELTGRKYLEEFIAGRLPVSEFEKNGDATFYLHDFDFHVMGFILLPKKVRELAQKQTKYLLDFIDDFKVRHPKEWSQPEFKLMMEKLIEAQIKRIDIGTGNFTIDIYRLLENETSRSSFLDSVSKMDPKKRALLHASMMNITGRKIERHSVRWFFENQKEFVSMAFEENDKLNHKIYLAALEDYIYRNADKPDFVDSLEIDSYAEVASNKNRKYGVDAVDLLLDRISELQKLQEVK